MRLWLDTSVLLAACGSDAGASAVVCRRAVVNGWLLIVTPIVIGEVAHNLDRVPATDAVENWCRIRAGLTVRPDVYTVYRVNAICVRWVLVRLELSVGVGCGGIRPAGDRWSPALTGGCLRCRACGRP